MLTTNGSDPAWGRKGYELTVTPDSVVIRAPTAAGLFYGVETLLQLLPPEIFAAKPGDRRGVGSAVRRDQGPPRFAWRGLMLDVSRHFFTKHGSGTNS